MKLKSFALARYFSEHEFTAKHMLCASDCQGPDMSQLLAMADAEMLGRWNGLALGYTETDGSPWLRETIAASYDNIAPADVLTMVPGEGIFAAMSALLEPGDRVVCTWPTYQSLHAIPAAIGCTVDRWIARPRGNGWQFDLGELRDLLRPDTKLLILNFPNNPTGAIPSISEFGQIMDLAEERGIRVFSDEMYRMLELHEPDRLPSASEVNDRAISLSAVSKVYGLAGLRLGWLVTKDHELRQQAWATRDYLTHGCAATSEVLAAIAIRSRKIILGAHRERVRGNLTALAEFCERHTDRFDLIPPVGGTMCLVRLRKEESAHAFCEQAVREAGTMTVPSNLFEFGDRHLRFGLGRPDFVQSLDVLEDYLHRPRRRRGDY